MVGDSMSKELAPMIAFAGGGTGGHLYPALAIAESLRKQIPNIRILFFGTDRAIDDRILGEADYEWVRQSIPAISIKPWQWISLIKRFRKVSAACRMRLASDRPMMVIGSGGMGSVPAMREARKLGIPTALMNPDVLPGRANRYLTGRADLIFVQWEDAVVQFPTHSKVMVTGCPVRSSFLQSDRLAGLKRFNLDPDKKTLLITGASQGARNINLAAITILPFLLSMDDWQILHLTGEADYESVCGAYENSSVRSSVVAYTDYMADALAASDLVIARAGASFLAELMAVGKASILIPYPYHKDQHQLANAKCLANVTAAKIVHDSLDPTINGTSLQRELELLMRNDTLRDSMAEAAKNLGFTNAADKIAQIILQTTQLQPLNRGCEMMEPVCSS